MNHLRRQVLIASISIGFAAFRLLQKLGFVDWITQVLTSYYRSIDPKVAEILGWGFLAAIAGIIGNRADALFVRVFSLVKKTKVHGEI